MKIQENSKKNLEQEIQAFKNEVCITRGRWQLGRVEKRMRARMRGTREEERRRAEEMTYCCYVGTKTKESNIPVREGERKICF